MLNDFLKCLLFFCNFSILLSSGWSHQKHIQETNRLQKGIKITAVLHLNNIQKNVEAFDGEVYWRYQESLRGKVTRRERKTVCF